jgi:hypothetical protein
VRVFSRGAAMGRHFQRFLDKTTLGLDKYNSICYTWAVPVHVNKRKGA